MTHLEFKPPCWVLYYNTLPQVIEQSLFLFFRIALLFEGAILKKKNGKDCSLRTYVEERPGWGRPQMGESIFPVWLTGPRDPRGAVFAKKKSHTNYNIILFYYLGGQTKIRVPLVHQEAEDGPRPRPPPPPRPPPVMFPLFLLRAFLLPVGRLKTTDVGETVSPLPPYPFAVCLPPPPLHFSSLCLGRSRRLDVPGLYVRLYIL